jgi:hypothetical protein
MIISFGYFFTIILLYNAACASPLLAKRSSAAVATATATAAAGPYDTINYNGCSPSQVDDVKTEFDFVQQMASYA